MEGRWQALPVALNAFDAVRDAAVSLAGDTPRIRQALLACDEWIANVSAYSGATRFAFDCGLEGNGVRMAFADDGIPFDPTADRGEMADFDDLDQGGMGLALIRQTASRMEYARVADGNVLTLWFSLSDPEPTRED